MKTYKFDIDLNNIENIERGLSDYEKLVRLKVIKKMVENGCSVSLDSFDVEERSAIHNLSENGVMILDNDEIVFCYPVSGKPTSTESTIGEYSFFCMCAIDAIGTHFLFHQDTIINSYCATTGEEIRIELSNGKIVNKNHKDIHAIHVDLNKYTDWASDC